MIIAVLWYYMSKVELSNVSVVTFSYLEIHLLVRILTVTGSELIIPKWHTFTFLIRKEKSIGEYQKNSLKVIGYYLKS